MKTIHRVLPLILGGSLIVSAQTSSYSSYGFGTQSPSNSVRLQGMGNAGIAVSDSMSFNPSNPALWQGFGSTSLQGQLFTSNLTITELDYVGAIANFSGFSFKLPVGKRAGFAIGLAPLTRMKSTVNFTDSTSFDGGIINYTSKVELTGGLSEMYFGGGYRISNQISVGLKAQILFGNYVVRNHTELTSDDNDLNSYYKRTISLNGNQISYGILYTDPHGRFNLAATIDQGARLKSWTTTENTYGPDTTRRTGNVYYPTIFTIGSRYLLANHLALNTDFRYGIYNKDTFKKFYVFEQFKSESKNSYAFNIGLEKLPQYGLSVKFLQTISYRCGFYYQTEPISLESGVNEYGFTSGISLPFLKNLNRIDLALTYGLRSGFLSDDIGKEKIVSLHVGVTTGEPWFRKYKRY